MFSLHVCTKAPTSDTSFLCDIMLNSVVLIEAIQVCIYIHKYQCVCADDMNVLLACIWVLAHEQDCVCMPEW